jgi:hypothetical protein
LAGGKATVNDKGETSFSVFAAKDDPDYGIIQSPFMQRKAQTQAFKRDLTVNGNQLSYLQETTIDIYGKIFDHTDTNQLTKSE